MTLQLTFKLELHSDYHVGAGYGRGTELDSALLRDVDGVPVLRGTILNGLLRDSVWRLLQLSPLQKYQQCAASGKVTNTGPDYCEQYAHPDHDPDLCPICRLFGTPCHPKRWYISSARPQAHPHLIGTAYQPDDLSGQRVMRVRVSPRTRRAAAHKLFSEEHGGQQTFTFTATCPTHDATALDEAALLVAAARFIRELGRSRRRGQGECLISLESVSGVEGLVDTSQAALLTRFEHHWLKAEPDANTETNVATLPDISTLEVVNNPSLRWRLLVRLDEPLIIAERAAAGNRFQSRDAIPGTVLRGALANQVAQAFDLGDSATYDAFLRLFLRDGVCFPTLYPLAREKSTLYAAIPTPRDAFACKVYAAHPLMWGTQGQGAECPVCKEQSKAARGLFYTLRQNAPERFSPEERVEMHIRMDPHTGRVKQGQLFDYVPLEAGQYFAGELRCADAVAWQHLRALTGLTEEHPYEIRLGKATRRGYGKVTVWLEPLPRESAASDWSLLPIAARVPEKTEEVTMTLLTDTIIQDTWGRFATGFDTAQLSQILGFSVSIVEDRDFAGRRVTDSYNTQWHLPRWRAVALTAGSSVRLRFDQPLTAKRQTDLATLERAGIGERRNEGYGKIVFNHPLYTGFTDIKATSVDIPEALEFESKTRASRREFCIHWQKSLDDFIREHAGQWARLRGEGQTLTALARWLMQHQQQDVSTLIEAVTTLGIADAGLKTLIREQGCRTTEDEYGDRPQKNRLEEIKALYLVKKLLQILHDQSTPFTGDGVRIVADRLAALAAQDKEA